LNARRVVIVALPVVAVAAVGTTLAIAVDGGTDGNGAKAPASQRRGHTAVVRRRTLVERASVDGTLGFSGNRSVTNRLSGTVTWLPRIGDVIQPGHTLFRVDGKPVVLMNGGLPAYRTLRQGVGDGPDVRQLERGLSALGYSPGIVDAHYTASTAAAVRTWQHALGLQRTGQVELGRVVFLPGARRVIDVKTSLGSSVRNGNADATMRFASYDGTGGAAAPTDTTTTPTETTPTPTETTPTPTQTTPAETPPTPTQTTPQRRPKRRRPTHPAAASSSNNSNAKSNGETGGGGGGASTEVLTTSSTQRVVTAKLDAADQLLVRRGQPVRVELPDGRFVGGRITNVGRVATADSGAERDPNADTTPKITITIRLRSSRAARRLDQAPVSVQLARTTRRHVLAVPVQALVARRGGRYAVELADGRLVGVEPGLFANGYVELTGGRVREGDRVRVPQ
jgi:hypothetical protein